MANPKKITCTICKKKSAVFVWDERYSGYRGSCSLCGYNWPES